jgi:hypothetical protein
MREQLEYLAWLAEQIPEAVDTRPLVLITLGSAALDGRTRTLILATLDRVETLTSGDASSSASA